MKSNELVLDLYGYTIGDIVKCSLMYRNRLYIVLASEYDGYELMINVHDIKNDITKWDLPEYYKKVK